MDKPTAATATSNPSEHVIGIDLGDRYSHVCVLDRGRGEVVEAFRFKTTREGLKGAFAARSSATVALEVSGHSRWVSVELAGMGHDVVVANPGALKIIYASRRKNDTNDAEKLARLARHDVKLLSPVTHRDEVAQHVRTIIKARDCLVRSRTMHINSFRGMVKAHGDRVPTCSARSFAKTAAAWLASDDIDEVMPEAQAVKQVHGVGELTAAAFVSTLGDPSRFARSRDVAAYFGLVPRQEQSGKIDRQLGITKTGDRMVRRLLVQCAQYILGHFGRDSDLRRWGLRLAERGGKSAKKRAVVAVARKLAVLLHRLMVSGEVYEPIGYGKAAAA
jgi:transposase